MGFHQAPIKGDACAGSGILSTIAVPDVSSLFALPLLSLLATMPVVMQLVVGLVPRIPIRGTNPYLLASTMSLNGGWVVTAIGKPPLTRNSWRLDILLCSFVTSRLFFSLLIEHIVRVQYGFNPRSTVIGCPGTSMTHRALNAA